MSVTSPALADPVLAPAPAPETLRERTDRQLGMALFIGSWTMAFGTLLLSFLVVRRNEAVWPPAGVALPSMTMAWGATLALLASSLVAHRAVALARAGSASFRAWWAGALLLGCGFAVLQSWLWLDVWAAGGRPTDGLYESIFYALTWFHAAHVACGLVVLAWIQLSAARGRCGPGRLSPLMNAATFWHFVDAVWVVLFLVFFVF